MTVRILVISDVHSNFPALEAVLKDAKEHGPYGVFLNAGDTVGYGPNPNECIQTLQQEGFVTVLGNHERAVRGGDYDEFNIFAADAVRHNAGLLTPKSKKWLDELRSVPYVDPKGRFAMVHGSFAGSEQVTHRGYEDIYISDERNALAAMKALGFDDDNDPTGYRHVRLGVFGHTHVPTYASCWIGYGSYPTEIKNLQFYLHMPDLSQEAGFLDLETRTVQFDFREEQNEDRGVLWEPKALFNPGSVGQPRHGSCAACYGIIELGDDGEITLQFRNVEYDITETQKRMRETSLPQHLIDRLTRGR
ncbi:MAG: metallophosphoesterase [Candidatus Aenigmarchaeota archaeon]|nr:metallophosphoesterase [Candidatus Aenigmarchaeota archaeon]